MSTEIRIRPARRSDRWAIHKLIWIAFLYPFGLHWRRFLVAETPKGQVVGCVQIRPYPGRRWGPWEEGCWGRELASLAVAPRWRRRRIGSRLVQAIQAQAGPPLYLLCLEPLEGYYARFGFRRLPPKRMPWPLRVKIALANVLLRPLLRRRVIGMFWTESEVVEDT